MGTTLSDADIRAALNSLPGWKQNGKQIERLFEFPDFVSAMKFVNKIADAAEAAQHHPDITINYNKVKLALISHDSGGVTQRDIRMAQKINQVAA
ncbi:MAG TPA: 4a-hydroxytetrahydrobiopterin dehydratase [Terriglobales bacterium]|nr:4a-hydroxytetrahydrobiopterin dehydratase [Terriglobales bacterium]